MKILNANSLLPQHLLDFYQRMEISHILENWLSLQGIVFTEAISLGIELMKLAYQRRLELNSEEPIVEHLILLAKQIALELDSQGKLLDLIQEKSIKQECQL